jgi:Flp pilus assembly protein TadD
MLGSSRTLSASGGPAADEIRIAQIQGTVEVSTPGSTDWVYTTTNQLLRPLYKLRTGPNSRVTLRWSDQSVVSFGALTVLEILPPHESGAGNGLNLLKGLLSFFHRDTPGRIRVITRGAAAGVKGTEFVVAVETNGTERTTLSVIDGMVDLSNPQGTLILTNGQQAVVELGKAPVHTAGFTANNVLQWCFYYPAVLDLRELPLSPEEEASLRESLAAYRAGDLLDALAKYPAVRLAASEAERVYYAALLLSVGEVEQTEAALSTLRGGDPSERLQRLATAIRQLIAAVKREPNPSILDPQLSTEYIAGSYYEQSRAVREDSLKAALSLARLAATHSPEFGFAWARVAELEFSFGHTGRALEALDKSLLLAPRNAQALALKGFLFAARNKTREAIDSFNRSMALDAALGNAWLGRGLCRIRQGDANGGREDLLVAAALEPQRSLLRSYLGKGYADAGGTERARHEFALAKLLDSADPTPWLYSALLSRQENQINAAVNDLEKSLQLNNNRRLFRSELLLDQDRAVRSASLASIYREAGLAEVSLREAASAVTYDYANYSAHLFLANSFDALRDPTRFNLRYETAWFNELLLANLLAPAGVGALSPSISQQEYFGLFERDRFGLTTTTDARSDGQYREVASQFGSSGRFSYSLDLDYQHNHGVRPNNELDRIEWYSQFKLQLTPQDSALVLTKYQDYHSGDNFQYFDPGAITVSTNAITSEVKTNTAYRPHFRFDEIQDPTVLVAYHREWSPGMHTLAMAGRLINDQRISDEAVAIPDFRTNSSGNLVVVQNSDFDVAYRSQFETWISEVNQIFQGDRNTFILGGRFHTGEFETMNVLTNATVFQAFFPPVNQTFREDFQRWSIYGYDTWEVGKDHLWLTAGLCYDQLRYPQNHRQVPISVGEAKADRLGPKAALVWTPGPVATVRGAFSRSLGGVSFDESYRLEPPQLAGFNQSFRSIMPESVVGSVSAPRFETAGVALDLKFNRHTYIGLLGEILRSDVDRTLGVYRGSNTGNVQLPSSTPQQLAYDEHSAGLTVNQLVSDGWTLGLLYKFTRSELRQALPEVPLNIKSDNPKLERSDLHTLGFFVLYRHSCGFFAGTEANWYRQDNLMRTISTTGSDATVDLPGDEFPQINCWVGYRFRGSLGDISVGLLNANATDYKLQPLNPYAELPRERVVAARVRLRF